MLKYLAELMPNCQTLKRCFVLFFATSYNALENDSRKKEFDHTYIGESAIPCSRSSCCIDCKQG